MCCGEVERMKERKRNQRAAGRGQRAEEDPQALIQELRIHQIELEMQNEELRQTRVEVESLLGQYADLYDFAPVGYFTLDSDGVIRRVNLNGARLLGEARAQLLNRRLGNFVSAADRPAFNDFLKNVFTNQAIASDKAACEVTLYKQEEHRLPSLDPSDSRHLDGANRRHVHIEATATEDGQLCRAVVLDITDRKRLETELLRMKNLESLGLVAGGIAHDFNNLLQGVLGNVVFAKMLLDPEDKAYKLLVETENIYESARQLTGKLLTFSKGGAPVKKTFDIKNPIRDWSSSTLTGSNIVCDLQFSDTDYLIKADEAQLRLVMQNLIINAKEAMPDGGRVTIRVDCTSVDEKTVLPLSKGLYVKISVADHGIGIPSETIDRVFDPYFSTKDKHDQRGLGLGLSICQSIINRHNGHIAVESVLGEGSIFTIYLPVSEREISISAQSGKAVPLLTIPRRVLFMDDEKSVSDVAKQYLEMKGFEVIVTRGGLETIAAYGRAGEQGNPFDVVVMDLTIHGGMGGIETIKELLQRDANVRAIVSSGYSDDPAITNYLDYGFKGALIKPYTMKTLEKMIGNVMGVKTKQLS